jgi:hypothetical protein
MKRMHLTRRSKIITGIIVVVVVAVLVVGFGTGLPGTGQKFMGSAFGGASGMDLMSDWLGAATGVVTITNAQSTRMLVLGYKHIGGGYRYQGEDILEPGETRSYDYKGICRIRMWSEISPVPTGWEYRELWIDGKLVYFIDVAKSEWTERGSGGGAGNELNLR